MRVVEIENARVRICGQQKRNGIRNDGSVLVLLQYTNTYKTPDTIPHVHVPRGANQVFKHMKDPVDFRYLWIFIVILQNIQTMNQSANFKNNIYSCVKIEQSRRLEFD